MEASAVKKDQKLDSSLLLVQIRCFHLLGPFPTKTFNCSQSYSSAFLCPAIDMMRGGGGGIVCYSF